MPCSDFVQLSECSSPDQIQQKINLKRFLAIFLGFTVFISYFDPTTLMEASSSHPRIRVCQPLQHSESFIVKLRSGVALASQRQTWSKATSASIFIPLLTTSEVLR